MNKIRHLRQILLSAVAGHGKAEVQRIMKRKEFFLIIMIIMSSMAYSQPPPPIVISSNTTWASPYYYYQGDIRIDSGATLRINNSLLDMYFDCKIEVRNGGRLIVDNSMIRCGKIGLKWTGIIMEPQGIVELNNESILMDAVKGIEVQSNNNVSNGYIIINSSTMLNCGVSVWMENYNSPRSYFINSNFEVYDSSPAGFSYFIYASGGIIPNIYGCVFRNNCSGSGSINPLCYNYGIFMYESKLNITRSAAARSCFYNLYTAILSSGMATQSISIQNTDFYNNTNGILVSTTGGLTIKDNLFVMDNGCSSVTDKIGVCVGYTTSYEISSNDLLTTNHNYKTIGMQIVDASTITNYIRYNSFDKLTIGIQTKGTNGAIVPGQGIGQPGQPTIYSGVEMLCNSFDECAWGINNDTNGIIGNPQGVYDMFGKTDAGNSFSNCVEDIYNENTNFVFTYYYSGSTPNTQNVNTELATIVAPCNNPFTNSDTASLQYYLLLKEQLNSDGNDNFTTMGQMFDIENISLKKLYESMANGEDKLDSLRMWYEAIDRYGIKYALVEVLQGMGEYAQAKAKLMSIPQNFILNAEQQAEHSTYVNFLNLQEDMRAAGRYWDSMTANDVSVLKQIAEDGTGRAKTMARSILCFFENICYEDENTEESDTKQYSHGPITGHGDGDVILYPNPTTDKVSIKWNHEGAVDIYVYGLDGTLKTKLQQVKTETEIDMSEYERGVYIYRILAKDSIFAGKIIKY